MRNPARAGRGIGQPAWLLLGQGHQIAQAVHRHAGIDRHEERRARDHADRRHILHRIERQLVQAGVDRITIGNQGQGVAIGRRPQALLYPQLAPRAGAVLHYHGLLQAIGQQLPKEARDPVVTASGGKGHDQFDRLRRIVVRVRAGNRCGKRRGHQHCPQYRPAQLGAG
ncbi:hypothetical protein D9M68_811190 [compost metagenome]